MSQFIVSDGVATTLADPITATSASITLSSSANLPTLLPGQIIPLILRSATSQTVFEVVYGTAIAGAGITVERAQEGSVAQPFNVGDYVLCGPTAGSNALITAVMQPVASETLPQAYGALVMPGTLGAAVAMTLPNVPPLGTNYTVFGSNYAVTLQTSVTSGAPGMILPDGSTVYYGTIPAGGYAQGMRAYFDGTNWRVRTFGNITFAPAPQENVFVSLSNGNLGVYSSDNGATWSIIYLPEHEQWQYIAYGNGIFLAVSATGQSIYSADGITWTNGASLSLASGVYCQGLSFGNGTFVAVYGTNDGTTPSGGSYYSSNGQSWTQSNLTTSQNWSAVGYGNGVFVAASYGSTVGAYSTDGINWTESTLPSASDWVAIAYGNGVFVVASSTGIAFSANGQSWTAATLSSSFDASDIAFGNGVFVAIQNAPSGNLGNSCAVSANGSTWEFYKMPDILPFPGDNISWNSIAFGNGLFIACSEGSNAFAISINGSDWTISTAPTPLNFIGMGYATFAS